MGARPRRRACSRGVNRTRRLSRAALIRSRQAHGRLEVRRALHLHIRRKRLAQAGGEEVDLVLPRQVLAAAQEGQELALVVFHGAGTLEFLDFSQRVGANRRTET